MRNLASALRGLIVDTAKWIDLEGLCLIAGVVLLAYGAALFDPRYPFVVIGVLLVAGGIALARPKRAA